jgi:hypothetical protein
MLPEQSITWSQTLGTKSVTLAADGSEEKRHLCGCCRHQVSNLPTLTLTVRRKRHRVGGADTSSATVKDLLGLIVALPEFLLSRLGRHQGSDVRFHRHIRTPMKKSVTTGQADPTESVTRRRRGFSRRAQGNRC